MANRRRAAYPLGMFDLVKGFGLIEIVAFHTLAYAEVSRWLSEVIWFPCAFMMACFFAVSGFQVRPAPWKQAVKRYTKTYIPMYLRLAAAVLLWQLIRWRTSVPSYILGFSLGVFYPKMVGPWYSGGIGLGWFILGLLWGSILLNAVLKIRDDRIRAAAVFALAVLGYLLDTEQTDYFALYRGLEALPAMYIGHWVYAKEHLTWNEAGWRRYLPYLLLVISAPFAFSGSDSMWLAPVWCLGDVIWGYAAVCVSRDTIGLSGGFWELVRKIGRYSPRIIIVHGAEMLCFEWEKLSASLSFIPNGDLKFLALIVIRALMLLLGCLILGKIDELENQWRRKKRGKKRAQRNAA